MKLCMRQKVFSWRDRFSVCDEAGNDRYFVEGELFSWGKKLHVVDATGREVAYIEQQILAFLPRYEVYVEGTLVATVSRRFSFFTPRYTLEACDGADWEVEGELWEHEYTVRRGEQTVVSIAKEWFTFGDFYALDIRDPADELRAVALVLAIDCAVEQQNS